MAISFPNSVILVTAIAWISDALLVMMFVARIWRSRRGSR